MRYLVSGEQMREADAYTIGTMGMPSLVLMERAALAVVSVMEQEGLDLRAPLILCGPGNNGGDGLAVARLLVLKGFCPAVWYLGDEKRMSGENAIQYQIAKNYGVSITNTFEEKEYSVIIDSVFGTGLTREPGGRYREALELVNALPGSKVAVDIPSGVSDTSGLVPGTAFRADLTVCLAFEKLGTVLYPGAEYAGKRVVAGIGIGEEALLEGTRFYTYGKEDLKSLLPERRENSHKGTYGKVLMIAGSEGMAGAAYLGAKAAYAVGAGLVQIYTPEENRAILQQLLPEAVVTAYHAFDREKLKELFDWADVVSIGSGLGTGESAEHIFTFAMQYAKTPCVIDGDGLKLLAEDITLLEHKKQVVLTPHMKEMARLISCGIKELQENRMKLLAEFVRDYPAVCALKDARTVVMEDGKDVYVSTTGNAAMAKAGSGDVLAGMTVGLLAQGMEKKAACETAVLLHGLCGDLARDRKGSYSVLAGELADMAGEILRELNEE